MKTITVVVALFAVVADVAAAVVFFIALARSRLFFPIGRHGAFIVDVIEF